MASDQPALSLLESERSFWRPLTLQDGHLNSFRAGAALVGGPA